MAGSVGEAGESISLNLNPRLDVFSILITFLLMSYSTDPVNYDVKKGIELPDSTTIVALDEIPVISVTPAEIYVNDMKISNILDGDVPESDRTQGAIFPLYEALKDLSEVNKKLTQLSSGETKEIGKITMEMHKEHPFKLMKRVMLSAQQADFLSFKLMVSKEMN